MARKKDLCLEAPAHMGDGDAHDFRVVAASGRDA
jgi:hypothetical protein